MPILGLTGAAGYVGGRVALEAIAQGWTVVGVDNLSGPVSALRREFRMVEADFASPEGLRALDDANVILHLAATSGVVTCLEHPVESRRVNVEGLEQLARWCIERRVPLGFASSLAVVGAPLELPVDELTPTAPPHEYARQKAEGERIVSEVARAGVPAVSARMSNLYGSYVLDGRTVAKDNILNLFARQAQSGSLRVYRPGTQRRDFVHVDDAARAWLALAKRLLSQEPWPLPVAVIAGGESYSILELADRVARCWAEDRPGGAPLHIEVVENPRAAIERLSPEFEVAPRRTWELLGVHRVHSVPIEIPRLLNSLRSAN